MQPSVLLSAMLTTTVVLLAHFGSPAEACMCMPNHPQTHFCNSEYVILARILRETNDTAAAREGMRSYKIAIKRTYKITERAQDFLRFGKLHTASDEGTCGIRLQIGTVYMIAGRSENLNLCTYVVAYRDLAAVERRGMSGAYRKGCACEVTDFPRAPNECRWRMWDSECATKFGMCVPKRLPTSANAIADGPTDGAHVKCHWRPTPAYRECVNMP